MSSAKHRFSSISGLILMRDLFIKKSKFCYGIFLITMIFRWNLNLFKSRSLGSAMKVDLLSVFRYIATFVYFI